jgi:hypothetical protein
LAQDAPSFRDLVEEINKFIWGIKNFGREIIFIDKSLEMEAL